MAHRLLAPSLSIVLVALVAGRAGSQQPAGSPRDGGLLTAVTDSHIAVTLDMRGVKFAQPSKREFEIQGRHRTIWLTNFGKDCLFYTGFNLAGSGDLKAVNRWNARDVGATRAYLDADGDPCLEMDVDFEGGISPFVLSLYFDLFFNAVDRFSREVVGEGPEEPARTAAAAPRAPAAGLLAAVVVAGPPQETGAPADDDEELLQPPLVEAALRAGGYAFESLDGSSAEKARWEGQVPIDRIEFRRTPALAYLSGQGLVLASRSGGARMSMERVNAWNRDHRFGRAYLGRDGRPVVVAALPVPLASRGALGEFFDVYAGTLREFAKFAGAKKAAAATTSRKPPQLGIWGVPVVVYPPAPPPTPPGMPVPVGPGAEPPVPGVKITAVAADSAARAAGLRPDDVIAAVSLEPDLPSEWNPNSPDIPSLQRLLAGARGFAWLWVVRGGAYHRVEPVRVRIEKGAPDA